MKRIMLLLLVLSLFPCIVQTPAHAGDLSQPADSSVELPVALPGGVTAINLRQYLGDAAVDVTHAWRLRENLYALLLRSAQEDRSYEFILLDTENGSLLSRTPVPYLDGPLVSVRPGWVDGVLHVMVWSWEEEPEDEYPRDVYINVSISPEGTVDVSDLSDSWYTAMPGGKTTIREAVDGSLYAIDVATGQEELLIQGVSKHEFFNNTPDQRGQYVPVMDELPDGTEDPDDLNFHVYDPEDYLTGIRDFGYVTPLDEHRFAYGISAWEWETGFGVYDLRTCTDHRITMDGTFLGEAGGFLFGSSLNVDALTYETSPLPESLHPTLEFIYALENDHLNHDISPDGKWLALTGRDSSGIYEMEHTVTITDLETGEIVKTYDIDNLPAGESTAAFYDDTHLMLFCSAGEKNPASLEQSEQDRSAYIFLIDIGADAQGFRP